MDTTAQLEPQVLTPPTVSLTKRQKAAVIVRQLLANGAEFSLTQLDELTLGEIGVQLASLSHVDQTTVDAVIREFLGELDHGSGLSFPNALNDAFTLLEGAVPPETAARLRARAGLTVPGNPWVRLGGLDAELLLPVLDEESVEVAAVLLSKLKVSVAADLLGRLPGERARRIAYAISLTGDIAPEVVQKIGVTLATQLDAQPAREFVDGPVERVGAILNFSPSATRDEVLEGLEKTDSTFADEVRKAIFTFTNIPERIDPKDVPKVTRDVDADQLITALAAAQIDDAEATEFILSNMSQRMADQLREEMEAAGTIKLADGEAAMNAVVGVIRNLEAAGEIFLVAEDE